jgi:hypothetical protein
MSVASQKGYFGSAKSLLPPYPPRRGQCLFRASCLIDSAPNTLRPRSEMHPSTEGAGSCVNGSRNENIFTLILGFASDSMPQGSAADSDR